MTQSLGTTFDAIHDDVCMLNVYWQLFNQLYSSKENADLMNTAAPKAFRFIQMALIDGIILRICRLTDPAESRTPRGCVENLTLANLCTNLPPDPSGNLPAQLEQTLDRLKAATNDFREHRNQTIAHSDKNTAITDEPALPKLTTSKFQAAIDEINSFMNVINYAFTDSTTVYSHVHVLGGGDSLIGALKQSKHYTELQKLSMFCEIDDKELAKRVRGY